MKKQNSNRLWTVFSILLMIILSAAEGFLLWQVWKLKMLPGKYFQILCGACLLLTIIAGLLLLRKKQGKWQKKAGWTRQIVGVLLILLILAGCFFGSRAVGQVLGTLDAITTPEKVNVILEIYVRQEDAAQYLQDTAGYTFAMAQDMPEAVAEEMRRNLEQSMGEAPDIVLCTGTVEAVDMLLSGQVDALILDNSYLLILEDMEGYEDVESRIRVLHEYIIEKEEPQASQPTLSDRPKAEEITDQPFLLYISGNDARRAELADGGSDVNILVLVNPQNHQVLMINTPRDYYVVNPASGNGSRDKLSHCGLRGIDNCVLAMEGLYGIPIDYYARINFSGFRTLIDAIGGVTVYSDRAFQTPAGQIYEGENHLDGAQALGFARERKNLPGGDNDRGKNQMKLISAMINQLSVGNLISNYAEILESLEGMFSTSMPAEDIGKLVQFQLTEQPSWEVLTFAVTGSNGNDMCWAAGGNGYVMYPHDHMVAHAVDLMERFLQGDVLTQADMVPQT